MTPTSKYGKAIKYKIPWLMPSAVAPSASVSRTALHMEHWALTSMERRAKKSNDIIVLFLINNKVLS